MRCWWVGYTWVAAGFCRCVLGGCRWASAGFRFGCRWIAIGVGYDVTVDLGSDCGRLSVGSRLGGGCIAIGGRLGSGCVAVDWITVELRLDCVSRLDCYCGVRFQSGCVWGAAGLLLNCGWIACFLCWVLGVLLFVFYFSLLTCQRRYVLCKGVHPRVRHGTLVTVRCGRVRYGITRHGTTNVMLVRAICGRFLA